MNPIPKKRRITDRKYLRWIKQQECLVAKYFRQGWLRAMQDPFKACVPPIDPHHVTPVSLGGSDKTAVPLCRKHHDYAQRGPLTFQETYGIVFDSEVARLRKEYALLNVKPTKERKPRTCRPKVESYRISCSCGRKHVSKDLRFWCTKVRDYLVAEL